MVLVNGKYHQVCDCSKDNTKYTLAKALTTRRTNRITRERALRSASVIGGIQTMSTVAGAMCLFWFFMPQSITYTAVASETSVTEISAASTTQDLPITAILPPKDESTSTIRQYALNEAKKAGIWVEKFEWMMEKESKWNPHARGDQKIEANGHGKCTNKKSPLYGNPANARGLAQITTCWYPQVTDEQADDYKFAVDFMIDQILVSKEHCTTQYSTCAEWYEKLAKR